MQFTALGYTLRGVNEHRSESGFLPGVSGLAWPLRKHGELVLLSILGRHLYSNKCV